MARLIWSPQAADDVEAACEYIARDSPGYATDFARRVVDAVAMLRRHPQLWPSTTARACSGTTLANIAEVGRKSRGPGVSILTIIDPPRGGFSHEH